VAHAFSQSGRHRHSDRINGNFTIQEKNHELGSDRRQLETITGKVKEKWGQLTDDDLTAIAGKRHLLAGKLQERYGYAKDQAHKELDAFAKTLEQ